MTPNDLIELFRLELDDTAEPYLWSDTELYAYLNEAQDIFVQEMGGIADRRSPLTKISYKADDQFKKYDSRIIRIKGAFDQDNKVITVKNLDNFATPYFEDDYGAQMRKGLDDSDTGPVRFIITDVEAETIQLYPIPEEEGFIRLYVYRRPLDPITGGSDDLEVGIHYHLSLLNWVKYKALLKQDAETFDSKQAAVYRVAFTDSIERAGKEKMSREDRQRTVRFSW